MKIIKHILSVSLFLLLSTVLFADTKAKEVEYLGLFDINQVSYIVGSGKDAIEIKRTMTSCAKNKGWFQPYVPAEGIHAVTEAEMLYALNDKEAIVVDMRTPDYFFKETIPRAINIPYGEIELRLDELGCTQKDGKWDCTKALKVYGFCNGPVCPQSPTAMKTMIRNGFPAEKIYYYRGGMLDWTALGLTTVKGLF
jgi:rhodanese-related sulfurtransferase